MILLKKYTISLLLQKSESYDSIAVLAVFVCTLTGKPVGTCLLRSVSGFGKSRFCLLPVNNLVHIEKGLQLYGIQS